MHKSGFINIIGNPNVGKSTLMNCFMGEKFSIITSKAQTTRHRILGIVNGEDFQLVFSDTPGILKPSYELQDSMMDFVKNALEDADIIIYMLEIGETSIKNNQVHKKILNANVPTFILLNKIDLSDQKNLEDQVILWKELYPKANVYPISALNNFNIDIVLKHLIELIPQSPPYFPKDQLTDKPERFFVNEILREKILLYYNKEIPYSVEVVTEDFKEEENIIKIKSVIFVERDSQKGIIIGHKGSALKKIGTKARQGLEVFFGKKIYIELQVKVSKNWRSNANLLKKFGYRN
ncbi:MAG: GTPase Era [Flavobacteriaceae bacterium]|nr:GTPase Era [Flavobacteriaceae bacterium]